MRLDVREALLALLFAAAFFQPTVLLADAIERVVADAQVEFADQAARGECGAEFCEAQATELRR